ncbi:LacI family DNA-binding transcriptional regulator [Paenibacillus sp. PK3_47]|uniref:LacI family DNA-binding transcriptional regulator n=1 Tax=Paenibacillus sp. PK3_47 TaxID=2072642 RepID=UPI00201E233C|nr:LacI family DNA-binding transcriptional regulator [Paenibacillus sp. PK3_47]
MKKATMKDIARLANVSVATVSYVLNDVKNQTIPEPTRESILQIAKQLNYVPNLVARSLVKQRTGLVGILINKTADLPYWKRQSYLSLAANLEARLTEAGYHTLLVSLNPEAPAMDIIRERKLDAVFVVDVRDDMFYRISANFTEGVPLILIGCLIGDPLFNQVNYNIPQALAAALSVSQTSACLVMEEHNNKALAQWIIDQSGLPHELIHIVNDSADNRSTLEFFVEQHCDKHIIVINEFLAKEVERLAPGSAISAVCTCGVPEILSAATRPISFQNDRAALAYELMSLLSSGQPADSLKKQNHFWVDVLE